ncbi:MAG: 50S ribosomal protein L4, partial [Ignavibacteria bacterium]|nr:50S ribosomal protein L4 [Ignavibacteria bacterium]
MELDILKTDGTPTGEKVKLSDEIFGIQPNEHAMYLAVRAYLGNQRQGTAKVKTRSEVRGGGKKPFKQKHTGMARQGSRRSPLMPGGGSIFGPKPRDYTSKLPRKMHRLARKSALSLRAKEGGILIVEDFSFEEPKTKKMVEVMSALKIAASKTLLLTPATDQNVARSGRNIPVLNIIEANKAS